MKKRSLGKSGLEVSALGFGWMGLSSANGPPVRAVMRSGTNQVAQALWDSAIKTA